MNHLQGKVKAIPVKKVTEGMQVWFPTYPTGKSTFIIGKCDENYIELKNDDRVIDMIHITSVDKLKTIVVEYYDVRFKDGEPRKGFEKYLRQLPLKYSQWWSVINNGEVDSDEVVKWKVSTKGNERDENSQPNHKYAVIVPQIERTYSEKELKEYHEYLCWLFPNTSIPDYTFFEKVHKT